jgi:hypothetical protein
MDGVRSKLPTTMVEEPVSWLWRTCFGQEDSSAAPFTLIHLRYFYIEQRDQIMYDMTNNTLSFLLLQYFKVVALNPFF